MSSFNKKYSLHAFTFYWTYLNLILHLMGFCVINTWRIFIYRDRDTVVLFKKNPQPHLKIYVSWMIGFAFTGHSSDIHSNKHDMSFLGHEIRSLQFIATSQDGVWAGLLPRAPYRSRSSNPNKSRIIFSPSHKLTPSHPRYQPARSPFLRPESRFNSCSLDCATFFHKSIGHHHDSSRETAFTIAFISARPFIAFINA